MRSVSWWKILYDAVTSRNCRIANIEKYIERVIRRKEILLAIIKVFLVFPLSPILNITIILLEIKRMNYASRYVSQLQVAVAFANSSIRSFLEDNDGIKTIPK